MINKKQAHRYCREDISLIENYELAANDLTQTWEIHHRAEILPCGVYSPETLMEFGLYWKRPASELVFMTKGKHKGLHNSSKPGTMLGKKLSESTKHKMSLARKGKSAYWNIGNNHWLGRHHTEETKKKISEARMGQPSWNKGIKASAESVQKMKQSHLGKHWWNNGSVEVCQKECPDGFVSGRLK